MNRCTGNCNQGRRPCDCRLGMPPLDIPIVGQAYERQPFPRVARWLDRHPRLGTTLLVLAMLAVFVLGAWLDGAPA